MDFNATIDLIIKDLNEASEIIDDLKKYQGVPALQVELAKSKCKSAGEVIALLKDQPQKVQEEKTTAPGPEKINPPQEKKKNESNPVEIITLSVESIEEINIPSKKTAETTIIADKFSHLSSRFNEQLAGIKGEEDVSDHLKSKKLISLSEAIGVNDRFLFIREIFDGNKDAYAQAISRLETAESLQDAISVIMSYTREKDENEAIRQLLDLVKRKFPLNE